MFFASGVLASSSEWSLQAADITTSEYAGMTLSQAADITASEYAGVTTSEYAGITCVPGDPGRCTCKGTPIGPSTYTAPSWLVSNSTSIYTTSAPLFGKETDLSHFRANASMIVNVASA